MSNHLSHQQMLAYLDGELHKGEMANVADHLHSCWTCRIEMERLEGDIATILDAHNESFAPSVPPPSKAWPTFEALIAHKLPESRRPIFLRVTDVISTYLTPIRSFALAGLVAGIVLFVFLRFGSATVSAKEAVANIRLAEQRQVSVSSGQIIRQRFHVKEKRQDGTLRQSNSVAAWKSSRAVIWQSSDNDDLAVNSLKQEYAAYSVAIDLPISSSALDAWAGVVGGQPSISKDGDRVEVAYHGGQTNAEGQLTRFSLRVVPNTWRVESMTLQFTDDSFEISEEDLSTVPTSQVPRVLLAELEPPTLPFVRPPLPARPISDTSAAIVPVPQINLDQVQVNVLTTLHRLGADLGEPVTVTHSGSKIDVEVWQLSLERQTEIRSALEGDPLVSVNAVPPKFRPSLVLGSSAPPVPSAPAARISVPSDDEDQRLLNFFGSAEKEQAFSKDALDKSTEVLAHLYALRNLQAQFPPERELQLTPSALAQLTGIVQDHVKVAAARLTELKGELAPLEESLGVSDTQPRSEDTGDTNWQNSSLDALATARAADRLLRNVLTTSENPIAPETGFAQLQQELEHLSATMSALQKK
jgi:hypothetical protein